MLLFVLFFLAHILIPSAAILFALQSWNINDIGFWLIILGVFFAIVWCITRIAALIYFRKYHQDLWDKAGRPRLYTAFIGGLQTYGKEVEKYPDVFLPLAEDKTLDKLLYIENIIMRLFFILIATMVILVAYYSLT